MAKKPQTIADLKPDLNNANKGTVRGLAMLEDSIDELGAGRSILIDDEANVIAGNKTLQAAFEAGLEIVVVQTTGDKLVVVQRTDLNLYKDKRARKLAYADNRVAQTDLEWDSAALLRDLESGLDLSQFFDSDELQGLLESVDPPAPPNPRKTLAERFIVPPFTVLDARQGYWQDRKRAWVELGIAGEQGRGQDLAINDPEHLSDQSMNHYRNRERGRTYGQDLMRGEHKMDLTERQRRALGAYRANGAVLQRGNGSITGTSIFDPVLCEIAYRWFCPRAGHVLDPFAGESTKGIVATYLHYNYTGIELRPEQVKANNEQAAAIGVKPTWITGDSAKLESLLPPDQGYDLIFTSPPYYDLEIYSDSDSDGSAFESYETFMAWYRDIFRQAVARLNDNRFVVVKVGEIRDKQGRYRNFVGDNIQCFLDCGLAYYNEAILVTAVGSLPVRVGKQFASGRKLGKTHQNILIFYKGDPRNIKQHFESEIEYGNLDSVPE